MKNCIINAAAKTVRFVAIASLTTIASCSNKQESEYDFLKNYGNVDFSSLRGKNIFVRGSDEKGSLIIFAIDSSLFPQCQDPAPIVIASVSNKSLKVDSVDYKLVKPSCRALLDESGLKKNINEFLKYNVNSIEVDNYGNVFIGMEQNGQSNLVKMVAPAWVDNHIKKNLVRIQGGWYKQVEQ